MRGEKRGKASGNNRSVWKQNEETRMQIQKTATTEEEEEKRRSRRGRKHEEEEEEEEKKKIPVEQKTSKRR